MPRNVYNRSVVDLDGRILNVAIGDIGDAQRRYTYFDLSREGYLYFTLQHIITATTITMEGCNIDAGDGSTLSVVASGTDAAGTTIIAVTLNSTHGFVVDDDLIGIQITVTADTTTPANVGAVRRVTDYVQATGTITLSAALPGPSTNAVTTFRVEDNPDGWSRRVSDPSTGQWRDMTNLLFGEANAVATGIWIVDTSLAVERLRINALTTNANNALALRLTRAR